MRSGYTDEYTDAKDHAMWRGRVASAMRGRRGQAFLRDALAALDEMPTKQLIANYIVRGGDVCLLGAVGRKRGVVDLDTIDPEDEDHHVLLAERFDVAPCLIQEIEFINDEDGRSWPKPETPEQRWERAIKWLVEHIKDVTP